jgi:hypothetical protein
MINAGHDFGAPRRNDKTGWAAVLSAGLRYEGFETCGCSRQPKSRPRTSTQVRARLRIAARTGTSEAAALAAIRTVSRKTRFPSLDERSRQERGTARARGP